MSTDKDVIFNYFYTYYHLLDSLTKSETSGSYHFYILLCAFLSFNQLKNILVLP